VFGGALEVFDEARDRDLIVIPGEEIKTDEQGEVIGLFLEREIPRGMTFADTVAAIREQGGLVYVPHPFDRLDGLSRGIGEIHSGTKCRAGAAQKEYPLALIAGGVGQRGLERLEQRQIESIAPRGTIERQRRRPAGGITFDQDKLLHG
jgi:hypothetical protein